MGAPRSSGDGNFMGMRVRRLVIGCLTAVVTAGPAAASTVLGGGPAWSDDPTTTAATLNVPADPAGDVVVTASADPVAAPYLQVKLVRGTTVAAPYEQIDAIDPAPVANPDGTDVSVTVPTWGLGGGEQATFTLLGCTSSDPTTCTSLLATQGSRITQQVLPAVAWDVPSEPVFWPQEDVTVTTNYDGGGRLQTGAQFLESQWWKPGEPQGLPSHGTTALTALPPESYQASYSVEVCSELTDSSAYCTGVLGSSRRFQYLGADSVNVVRQSRPVVTVDPSWYGSTVHLLIYRPKGDHDLSWVLRDSSGKARSASVDPGGLRETSLDTVDVVPGEVADGPLEDGTYTLDFTATYRKNGLTATTTGSTEVQVVNDPPADHPAVTVVRRTTRPGGGFVDPRAAEFLVQSYPHSGQGRVHIFDANDHQVAAQTTSVACGGSGCGWDVHAYPYDDDGAPLAAGRYIATFEMPDSYGRPMTVDLGEVDVQHVVHRHRIVQRAARRAVVRGAGFVGRCAAVRRPGTLQHRPGSLGLVSHARCSRSTHRADVAQQVFRIRVPRLATADELSSMDVSAVVHGTDRRVVNTFPTMRARWEGASRWSRPHGLFSGPGWKPTGWQRSSSRPDLQSRWVDVRVAVDHGVRADVDKVGLKIDYYVWRTPRS